ncbi:MAG: hypothetical protein QGG36_07615 [Pirellulaceae bacterium]|nr:hypothetical protein [Pirellulaceae bacterium]
MNPNPPSSAVRRFFLWSLAFCLIPGLTGCRPELEIEEYEAPKSPQLEPVDRMLGAVILNGDQAWFFKATGSIPAIDKLEPSFRNFVGTVTFQDQRPEWTAPDVWKSIQSTSQFRYATFQADVDGEQIEVTVIPLPYDGEQQRGYLLSNVNRWRGELQQRGLVMSELDAALEPVEVAGLSSYFTTIRGVRSKRSAMAPFAGGALPAPPDAGPREEPPSEGELTYDKPVRWQETPKSAIRKAAFLASDAETGKQAQITVIPLGGSAGGFGPNVNRWRDEVGLPEITTAEAREDSETIQFAGQDASFVTYSGDVEGFAAVIATRGELTWFVKMKGAKEIVKKETRNFKDFVTSIRFKGSPDGR